MDPSAWQNEIKGGKRFEFGKNWKSFLSTLNEERITNAQQSLVDMLEMDSLEGKTFLDFGSGSGLFSLAAYQLGANVKSIDFDPNSVACAKFLKEKFFNDSGKNTWDISEGSVLNPELIQSLDKFDIVYSWGVLHHTGAMWDALENVSGLTKEDGTLFISIYNDQGKPSRRWLRVKKAFNSAPHVLKQLMMLWYIIRFTAIGTIKEIILFQPFKEWKDYKKNRGMSRIQNIRDWIGGLPFEVAKPEQILFFYKKKGFDIRKMVTCAGGIGCNEFVFKKGS